MKISLAHKSASKLIAVRAETNKSISELMEEAMQFLVDKYNVSKDTQGWIEWNGGNCPVSSSTDVGVKFRTGYETLNTPSNYWAWHHDKDSSTDIIAYRLTDVKTTKEHV